MAWTEVLSLVGASGNSVLSGSGAPSGGTGVNGDFYINTATSDIYGPKAAGSWGSPTSLIGATGSTGGAGATGATGSAGADGADGAGLVWSDRVETLTDGATVTPNALSGLIQVGLWTCATATPTLNPPDNGVPGAPYRVQVLASGAQRVITLSSGFIPSTDDVVGTVTVPSGKWCSLFFEYFTTVGWMYAGKKTLQ